MCIHSYPDEECLQSDENKWCRKQELNEEREIIENITKYRGSLITLIKGENIAKINYWLAIKANEQNSHSCRHGFP